jgi:hypothetical protein
MDQLTSFERDVLSGKICPYCMCETIRVTDREIYGPQSNYNKSFIQCIENRDHYVGTFSNGQSLGRLADAGLRKFLINYGKVKTQRSKLVTKHISGFQEKWGCLKS